RQPRPLTALHVARAAGQVLQSDQMLAPVLIETLHRIAPPAPHLPAQPAQGFLESHAGSARITPRTAAGAGAAAVVGPHGVVSLGVASSPSEIAGMPPFIMPSGGANARTRSTPASHLSRSPWKCAAD